MGLIRIFWNLFAPIWNHIVGLFAYGPWGPLVHREFIRFFKTAYGITDSPDIRAFRRLGDFFLRDRKIDLPDAKLVSPVEAYCLEACTALGKTPKLKIKGLEYRWSDFPELENFNKEEAVFWNFYLAPNHYHWFHAACSGTKLEATRFSGSFFPVNSFGRWLCPWLYNANERLSFRWQHEEFGKVVMMCVGAVGVSKIRSEFGLIEEAQWKFIKDSHDKGERFGAFELGSSVLLFLEKRPNPLSLSAEVLCGEALIRL